MTLDIEDLSKQDNGGPGLAGSQFTVALQSSINRRSKTNKTEPDIESSSNIPGCARIWVKTFGCAHNVSDSEYMMGQLQAYGYK